MGLAAEFSFRTHFAGHALYFGGEGVELIHHGVDGVLQLENFAFHVNRDFARQIAAGHGSGYFGNVTHLSREVSGHGVDRVSEILPRAGHPRHVGLSTESAFATYFAGHAGYFGVSVSLSCRISPRTSTVILRERSPLAMAVATSAMLRT